MLIMDSVSTHHDFAFIVRHAARARIRSPTYRSATHFGRTDYASAPMARLTAPGILSSRPGFPGRRVERSTPMTKREKFIRFLGSWLRSAAFAGAAINAPELAAALLPPQR
jgi:hypothetical protein